MNHQVVGILELQQNGSAVVRDPARNFAARRGDPVLSARQVQSLRLRGGELIEASVNGRARPDESQPVREVARINGLSAADYAALPPLTELTVVDPRETIRLETGNEPLTTRVIDLMTPIGKGQRGLIVAPPRSGKTVLLQQIAHAVRKNHPEVLLMMLLVDERPEEVTEMRRSVCADGSGWSAGKPEVVWSSNDQNAVNHLRIARLMIERARRMVETGREVLILLDSLTRLSRAFNSSMGSSGRTMTGGLDINALSEPKAMFGAARKIENGGSLTIIASVLVETGSRMDDFIFQEYKGTGNMELVLNREIANLRIWPAIDLQQSGTRKEELLLDRDALPKIYRLRRRLAPMPPLGQVQTLLRELDRHPTNAEFLAAMAS